MSKTAYNGTLKGYVGGEDFDYEALARELFMCEYYFDNGHVFRHY